MKEDFFAKKHDAGKVRMDLVPLDVIEEIARVFTFGCTSVEAGGAGYEEGSWKDVPEAFKRYKAADLRHLAADARGETLDPVSGLPHLAHHAWNAIALLWLHMHGKR